MRGGPIVKHPQADNLSIAQVFGYPVIIRTGEYAEGDRAVYVPVDGVVPEGDPRWAFLGEHRRIRAKKLRGVFSMGLLTAADPSWAEGQDVREPLGITKYDPPEPDAGSGDEPDPGFLPPYTDIEGLRRWPGKLVPGEEVVLTEKLHGENGRFLWHEGRLWCGSRTRIKAESPGSAWWRAARAHGLAAKLATVPGIAVYGEVHGYTGGFPYGVDRGVAGLRLFDALDIATRQYLDHDAFLALARQLDLPVVPPLFRGPWSDDLRALAEGPSTLAGHVREGFVVRPVQERQDLEMGRVVLKLIGEGFLLRKGG
ncbi:MAG: hypothetical protein EOO75_10780 [Myxococcales bacterium]|nr:MAG: hypothetical protein EOO75_10780 [Myxococcales bacterium]